MIKTHWNIVGIRHDGPFNNRVPVWQFRQDGVEDLTGSTASARDTRTTDYLRTKC